MQSVEPLCRPEQFVFFDRFVDGDAYTNPKYRVNFREILHVVREKRYLNASYRSNKGNDYRLDGFGAGVFGIFG